VPQPLAAIDADDRNNTVLRVNMPMEIDQTNGTISCYYVAIVPLSMNTTIKLLPRPDVIDFTTPDNVFRNNVLDGKIDRWFAYVAESMSE
jgi:hypothetical protein